MADDAEGILDVVGALHAGVADSDQWSRGLDSLSDLLDGPALMFGSAEFANLKISLTGHRFPQEAVDLMAGPLANPIANPYVAAIPRLPLRRPVNADDLGGQAVIEGSDLWREVMTPFDVPWSMGVLLERQPERADFLMLGRSTRQGDFSKAHAAGLALLAPHLARTIRVRRELEAAQALAADCMAVLDKLNRGVVMVDANGSVRFVNQAAESIFRQDDGLTAASSGLRADRSRDTAAIQAIARTATETGVGRARVAVDALSVSRRSGKAAFSVVAEPLSPAHRERLGAPRGSGAVLFLGDSETTGAPSAARLAVVYGLSPAEAGVAASVSKGELLRDIADANGVSEGTVRTHLKAVFAKVGVNRQAQLAARIAADLGGFV